MSMLLTLCLTTAIIALVMKIITFRRVPIMFFVDIEKAIEQSNYNKFQMINAISERAKSISRGSEEIRVDSRVASKKLKPTTQALLEVSRGYIKYEVLNKTALEDNTDNE